MLGTGRHYQHVRRTHIERPVGDAVFCVEQHSDNELVVGRHALGANADGKRADAERKISDSDMAQMSPGTFRGRAASPRHEIPELHGEDLRNCPGCSYSQRSAGAWRSLHVVKIFVLIGFAAATWLLVSIQSGTALPL
jgi:hypothetical protein